jgi:pimeloyl-ACP methyl ester carboxylesterase
MQRPVVERELGRSYIKDNPEGVSRFLSIARNDLEGGTTRMRQRNARPNSPERLATIRTPTLVIAADEDLYAPPEVMQFIADSVPGATLEVIKGAGHSAYWEKPDQWNKLAIDFLKDHVTG